VTEDESGYEDELVSISTFIIGKWPSIKPVTLLPSITPVHCAHRLNLCQLDNSLACGCVIGLGILYSASSYLILLRRWRQCLLPGMMKPSTGWWGPSDVRGAWDW